MSYFYVYDKFVQDRKHEKELARIEQRLVDIGIQGKIGRLSLFRQCGELVRDEVKRGAETVVVVGNDDTFHSLMEVLPELKVVTGLIPLGDKNRVAEVLGIPMGLAACDVLSARLTETFDVGKINHQYFLTSVEIPNQSAVVDCGGYTVQSTSAGGVEIRNLGSLRQKDLQAGLSNPRDGLLEAVVYAELPKEHLFARGKMTQSSLLLKSLRVTTNGLCTAIVDNVECQLEKMQFQAVPRALRVITGKGRMV